MNLERTAEQYLQVWNERDPRARRTKVAELFTPDCSYTDPRAAVTGHEGLDALIGAVQAQLAGVSFSLASAVDAHHDVARFTWHAHATPGAPLAIGFDVMVLEGGKIKQVVGFLDKAPKGAA